MTNSNSWVEGASLPSLKRAHYLEQVFGEEPPEGYIQWVKDLSLSSVEVEYFKRKLLGQLVDKLLITGTVNTVEELPLLGNNKGDVWFVKSIGHAFLWLNEQFEDLGSFNGEKGPKGDPGIQGPPGEVTKEELDTAIPVAGDVNSVLTKTASGNSWLPPLIPYTDRVYVSDFGPVGNGIYTEDEFAIESAINAAYGTFGEGGKTVVFDPVTYNTRKRIRLRGNLHYKALGATFTKTNVSQGYAVFMTQSKGAKGYGSGDSNWSWEGGTFRGDFSLNNMICPFALHHSDNFEIYGFECYETQGIGHNIDMGGCSNFKIHSFKAYGFKNSSTGGYDKSEFIQVDMSTAGAISAVDDPGSFDGLMSINGEIYKGLFSSIVSNGVFYSAPNPVGSHTQHEERIPSNINIHHNIVINPHLDVSSGIYGAIHFIGGENLTIEDNIFYFTEESPHKSSTLVGLYSTNWGIPLSTAQYEAGASNVGAVLSKPLKVRNVSIGGNKVWGAGSDGTRPLFSVVNKSDTTATVYAENVVTDTNLIEVLTGSSALNAFDLRDIDGLYFKGRNQVKGPVRAVNSVGCKNISLDDFEIISNRSDAIRFDNFERLRIKTIGAKSSAGTSLYINSGKYLEVLGGMYESLAGSRAIAINGVDLFQVSSVKTISPSSVVGVQVYSNSSNGQVDGVIATGGAITAVQNGSSSVISTRELVVPVA